MKKISLLVSKHFSAFLTSIRSLAEILRQELHSLKKLVLTLPYNLHLEMVLNQQFETLSCQSIVR
jgi:hypothetical protein